MSSGLSSSSQLSENELTDFVNHGYAFYLFLTNSNVVRDKLGKAISKTTSPLQKHTLNVVLQAYHHLIDYDLTVTDEKLKSSDDFRVPFKNWLAEAEKLEIWKKGSDKEIKPLPLKEAVPEINSPRR